MTDRNQKPGRSRRRFTVDALFTDTRPQAEGVTDLANAKEIELQRIEPDPDQPRTTFDEDRLQELAASIRAEGILQPIVVRYDEARDIYVIVHGERRWRASKLAERTSIPALVRDVPEERRLLQQLMENVVRDDLNAIDRAAALRALRDQLGGVSWEQVAEAVGIKRSRLFQLLGTEKLPAQAQEDIQSGRLSEKQSRALQGLPEVRQDALRELVVTTSMSAATAGRLARAFKTYPIQDENDPAAVKDALGRLYDLVEPGTPEALQSQTNAVFEAIRSGESGRIASLLAAPTFDSNRMTREVSTLARTLSRVDAQKLATSPDTRQTLQSLRDALDALLERK
jgi:ParB family chromosome partitioning protein